MHLPQLDSRGGKQVEHGKLLQPASCAACYKCPKPEVSVMQAHSPVSLFGPLNSMLLALLEWLARASVSPFRNLRDATARRCDSLDALVTKPFRMTCAEFKTAPVRKGNARSSLFFQKYAKTRSFGRRHCCCPRQWRRLPIRLGLVKYRQCENSLSWMICRLGGHFELISKRGWAAGLKRSQSHSFTRGKCKNARK